MIDRSRRGHTAVDPNLLEKPTIPKPDQPIAPTSPIKITRRSAVSVGDWSIVRMMIPVGVTRQLTPNLLEKPTIPQTGSTDRANITDRNNGRSAVSVGDWSIVRMI